jgi:microcystin-dependent protein
MHHGNGYILGNTIGTTATTLTLSTMPTHVHPVDAKITMELGGAATTTSTDSTFLAAAPAGSPRYSAEADDRMAQVDIANMMGDKKGPLQTEFSSGGTQPFDNMKPYLAINFIIALQGIFPSAT